MGGYELDWNGLAAQSNAYPSSWTSMYAIESYCSSIGIVSVGREDTGNPINCFG